MPGFVGADLGASVMAGPNIQDPGSAGKGRPGGVPPASCLAGSHLAGSGRLRLRPTVKHLTLCHLGR